VGLLKQYFSQHEKWRYIDFKQYEEYMEILLRYTLKLYSANVILTECYVPISEIEKYHATLFGKSVIENMGSSIGPSLTSPKIAPKILTSLRSPSKDEYFRPLDVTVKLGRSLSHISTEDNNKYIQSYNPSIFHICVEISLNKTLLYLLSALIEPISLESQQIESSFSTKMKELSAGYGSRWNEDISGLMDCVSFGVHSYEKCMNNYRELEQLIQSMNSIYSAVDFSIKHGALNHLRCSIFFNIHKKSFY